MNDSAEILADRLNNEPPIFRGLSNSELGMVLKVGALFWVPVCLTIATILGKTMMGMGAAMLMLLLTILVSGSLFQRIKRGRPDYYYQHYLMLRDVFLRVKTNTKNNRIIRYSGTWGVGRTDGE
ncbi:MULTISPECIES: TIGR03750 family conjugal transfer protein [Methylophaga]|jgi:conjugative transfer region protein (TIGR03750 family)|uniref:TIGR03750 family conjugal transfer protein n=1 Tax=Methylophaga TaxID=40222 RepID=UPI001CF57572|nr:MULTISPECIES: TIGR03750 family conjugal transfer protein [Methylophaga]MCB2425862.1 TIGR03750 family conjugal transfer protein [Methylophaga pinxianii]MDO8826003.1 TIGR03750 family conjugal transfer protein [Methylophaga sp.]MDX1750893.1 TIGR03750 family conjugal transfer protein [Methylophaga sp.]UPH47238.1 TIGR03750 family conjugal transfer protein [Methylophaga pinxianii]|tara:strand:+ start:11173 stop:11544 length:372 start_codon:yes stop_codon:yes gene_type:complete